MGFFTLLLLGAIFVGSNAQIQEPIRRLPSQYDRVFEKQGIPNNFYLSAQSQLPQYQLISQKSLQQASAQQLPKLAAESSPSVEKPRLSETQEQALYAQEILKNDELAKQQPGARKVTTVCVQVHSDNGNPVVCGPQIPSGAVQNYKSPPQEQVPPERPSLSPSVPVRTQTLMRLPVYNNNYITREVTPYTLNCKASPLGRFTNDYRLSSAVPVPLQYGMSLGFNEDSRQAILQDGTISPYNWGAPLSRSALDSSLLQDQLSNSDLNLRKEQLDGSGSQLRTSDSPLLNFYSDSIAKSIDDVIRASENSASPSSYFSTVPGMERSNDQTALQRLEESREKLRKLTKELEEVKKARLAEDAARADEQKQLSNQPQTQQLTEEDRKRLAQSQQPLRPAQIGEREIRQ